jgi:hypothetical protein
MIDIGPFIKARVEILDRIEVTTKALGEAKAALAEAEIDHVAARGAHQAALERANIAAGIAMTVPGVILRNIAETVGEADRRAAGVVARLKQEIGNLEWSSANMADALAQVERAINPSPAVNVEPTGAVTHEVTEEVDWTANGWPEIAA